MEPINPRRGSSNRPEPTSAAARTAKARATRRTPAKKALSRGASVSLTCVINEEEGGYVSRCPELDVASQGDSIEQARANLIEAVELFLECASPSEIKRRSLGRVFITPFEVRLGGRFG
jgi:predicted RNase H-like HicB family nuclease